MKILIVTQHLHPMQTPRAHRSTELIKEFCRSGHEVTVYAVTGSYDYKPLLDQYRFQLKKIPLRWQWHPYNSDGDGKRYLIDKILSKLLAGFFFPDIEFKYILPRLIKDGNTYDCIISIADPHPIHWGIAAWRSKYPDRFPKLWIADCGDPFMNNGNVPAVFRKFEREERRFCELCDYITVPVESARGAYYPEYRDKIRIIPQGFDFDINDVPVSGERINAVPRFAYAGTFLKDIRNPGKIMDYLIRVKKDFIFEIYSAHTELINGYRDKLGEKLIIRQPVRRADLIGELKKMDFLMNVENYNSPGQLPSKIIDYALTGRPILSLNPEQPDFGKLDQFLEGNFSGRLDVRLSDYHISNVARLFLDLMK